jgi:uncharacterized DUF497 family protein
MAVVYRPWISPYSEDDFEWDRKKSQDTFADRDFIFEAARIVFRGPLVRRQDTRRWRSKEPRFMVLGELYGRVEMIIYTPRKPEMPHHFDATGKRGGAADLL